MASGENIVRLTYKQLKEMASSYDQDSSKEQHGLCIAQSKCLQIVSSKFAPATYQYLPN